MSNDFCLYQFNIRRAVNGTGRGMSHTTLPSPPSFSNGGWVGEEGTCKWNCINLNVIDVIYCAYDLEEEKKRTPTHSYCSFFFVVVMDRFVMTTWRPETNLFSILPFSGVFFLCEPFLLLSWTTTWILKTNWSPSIKANLRHPLIAHCCLALDAGLFCFVYWLFIFLNPI